MVQLSDDSVHGTMLRVEDAIEHLGQLLTATCAHRADEHILPIDADNRVIAQDISARVNVPAYENSAVDGYAFAHASLDQASASTTLRLLGDAEFAGQEAGTTIAAGQAVQITTGAAMPPGTDTVCMFEDVLGQQTDNLKLPSALKIGDNVRPEGEDFAAGEPILRPGMRFNPIQLAALIATGHGTAPLAVRPKVRILVCSTGDELGQKAGESVLDANGPMLTSFLKHRWQFDAALHTAVLPDDDAAVAAFFTEQAPKWDVIITTGAVSTGDRDFMRSGFQRAGGTLGYWRVAIKPGRPIAVGTLGQAVWIGLPGNPVAALVTLLLIALPALRMANGEPADTAYDRQWVQLTHALRKKKSRTEYTRVHITRSDDPEHVGDIAKAARVNKIGAGMISSLLYADGLAELGYGDDQIEDGTILSYIPWEQFGL